MLCSVCILNDQTNIELHSNLICEWNSFIFAFFASRNCTWLTGHTRRARLGRGDRCLRLCHAAAAVHWEPSDEIRIAKAAAEFTPIKLPLKTRGLPLGRVHHVDDSLQFGSALCDGYAMPSLLATWPVS